MSGTHRCNEPFLGVALSHVRTTVNGAIELSSALLKLCGCDAAADVACPPLPLWTLQRMTREMQEPARDILSSKCLPSV